MINDYTKFWWGDNTLSVPFTPTITTTIATFIKQPDFNPVDCGSKSTHLVLILDESGSMDNVRENTISALNEYIESQKKEVGKTGIATSWTLCKFDGYTVKTVFDDVNIMTVPKLTLDDYVPSGGTNLFDAIGKTLVNINEKLKEIPQDYRPSIITTIITDGEENMSREFSKEDIKKMVSLAGDAKWSFLFMGANINAFSAGYGLGMNPNATIQLSGSGQSYNNAFATASAMASRMRSSYLGGIENFDLTKAYGENGFTEEERKTTI